MVDQTDRQALRNLQRDDRFLELDYFVPSLRIVRSFGIERDEVAHSRLLASLLDPRQHRGAEIMLRAMLRGMLRQWHFPGNIVERLSEILGASWTSVDIQREFQFIDIVVKITSSRHTIIVGIENKIDAMEGDEQLGRYQNALARAFPMQASFMVFLTPTGREPTTAIWGHPVPTVSADYSLIVEAAEEALLETEPASRDHRALNEITMHLREDILGEETEVKALVRELWRTHGKALRLAMEHRPRLEDIRDLYEALLSERFGNDVYTYYWQPRGELREIKMSLTSWEEAGFPFEFILRVDDKGLPLVRLLVWRESYEENAAFLRKWARN